MDIAKNAGAMAGTISTQWGSSAFQDVLSPSAHRFFSQIHDIRDRTETFDLAMQLLEALDSSIDLGKMRELLDKLEINLMKPHNTSTFDVLSICIVSLISRAFLETYSRPPKNIAVSKISAGTVTAIAKTALEALFSLITTSSGEEETSRMMISGMSR